ncbi:MAG: PH domain-containing protein [Georgenia sp.]
MTSAAELHATFRPRWARRVSVALAVLTVAGTLAVLIALPRMSKVAFTLGDGIGTVLLALVLLWLYWRQGGVRAVPDETGLRVRNIIYTRTVEWAQIVTVTFGASTPWVQLDLSEGDTLAVMAIQRADGAYGRDEARRLATLIAYHEPRDGES